MTEGPEGHLYCQKYTKYTEYTTQIKQRKKKTNKQTSTSAFYRCGKKPPLKITAFRPFGQKITSTNHQASVETKNFENDDSSC